MFISCNVSKQCTNIYFIIIIARGDDDCWIDDLLEDATIIKRKKFIDKNTF